MHYLIVEAWNDLAPCRTVGANLESDQLDSREHAFPMYLQDIDKIVDVSAMLKP